MPKSDWVREFICLITELFCCISVQTSGEERRNNFQNQSVWTNSCERDGFKLKERSHRVWEAWSHQILFSLSNTITAQQVSIVFSLTIYSTSGQTFHVTWRVQPGNSHLPNIFETWLTVTFKSHCVLPTSRNKLFYCQDPRYLPWMNRLSKRIRLLF